MNREQIQQESSWKRTKKKTSQQSFAPLTTVSFPYSIESVLQFWTGVVTTRFFKMQIPERSQVWTRRFIYTYVISVGKEIVIWQSN